MAKVERRKNPELNIIVPMNAIFIKKFRNKLGMTQREFGKTLDAYLNGYTNTTEFSNVLYVGFSPRYYEYLTKMANQYSFNLMTLEKRMLSSDEKITMSDIFNKEDNSELSYTEFVNELKTYIKQEGLGELVYGNFIQRQDEVPSEILDRDYSWIDRYLDEYFEKQTKSTEKKSERIGLVLKPSTIENARALASITNMSLTSFIEKLIDNDAKRNKDVIESHKKIKVNF